MRSQAKGPAGRRRLALLFGVVVLAGVVACAARVQDNSEQAGATAKHLTAHSAEHLRGPVNAVVEAVRAHGHLTVAQQKTLDAIAHGLEEDRVSRTALHHKLRASAAAIVRSGSADSAQFERSVDQAMRVLEQRVNQRESALERIHDLLSPEQRAAVAAALRARIDEKFGRRCRREMHRHAAFKRLASYLSLSASQIDQLKAAKKELFGEKKQLRPTRAELLALVNAFEGDRFSGALKAFSKKKMAIVRQRVSRAGRHADSMLALLTPDQRNLLADLILKGPSKVLFGTQGVSEPAASPRLVTPR